jgi:hypothetical protein
LASTFWECITVEAPVLAAAIQVEAVLEAEVRAVVVGAAAAAVAQEQGARQRVLLGVPIGLPFQGDALKAIGRVAPDGASPRRWSAGLHKL